MSAAALLVAIVGLVASSKQITGVDAWLKPAKFGISIVIYVLTLAWLLSLVEGHRRLVRAAGVVTAVALIGELVLIDLQVIRGTTSHFNDATSFDAAVFDVMGVMIALVFIAAVVVAVLLIRQRSLPEPLATGIRGGLLVALLGMAEAGLMIANRTWQSGGGHTVGAKDGGPGLPLLGWSTQHGDLRAAHFVGLHALQALLLIAWAVGRFVDRPVDVQRNLTRLAVVAAAGLVVLLAWQAERGRPLLHPDTPVSTAGGIGLAAVVVAALAIGRRKPVVVPRQATARR